MTQISHMDSGRQPWKYFCGLIQQTSGVALKGIGGGGGPCVSPFLVSFQACVRMSGVFRRVSNLVARLGRKDRTRTGEADDQHNKRKDRK